MFELEHLLKAVLFLQERGIEPAILFGEESVLDESLAEVSATFNNYLIISCLEFGHPERIKSCR